MGYESIDAYHAAQSDADQRICALLRREIDRALPEADSRIWHGHPVWFLDGNPIVGYSRLKASMRLLFWSGQSFNAPGLAPEGKFKAAEARYTAADQVDPGQLQSWLTEARTIQWDYKNIVKRKGELVRLS